MPAVGITVGDNKREYPGNLTPFVTVTCVVAAMGGLIFGYDIGISGNSFYIKFNALKLDFGIWIFFQNIVTNFEECFS